MNEYHKLLMKHIIIKGILAFGGIIIWFWLLELCREWRGL